MNLNKMLRIMGNGFLHTKHTCIPKLVQPSMQMATNASVSRSRKEKDNFLDVLPSIIDSISKSKRLKAVPNVGNWVKKVLEYNLAGGKLIRGLTTVHAYEMLEKPENINEESMRAARIMGWCTEFLQAYLLVLDDVMDSSTTRRGVPCWYKLPDVGLGALNDSIFILCSIHELLKTHFRDKPYYTQLIETFNEILFNTSIGQHLDFEMAHRNKHDYSMFVKERYDAIVKYKTAYYTYKLPVSLGMYLANKTSEEDHSIAEEICLDIGRLFQMQDDYLDCYGDESITGKYGTDIQEGKCSWLAVTALEHCTPAQHIVFEGCYGSKDPEHIESIKQLYKELQIQELYRQEEFKLYNNVMAKINKLPEKLSPQLYTKLVDVIYKRNQ